jgi:hypothetical protein
VKRAITKLVELIGGVFSHINQFLGRRDSKNEICFFTSRFPSNSLSDTGHVIRLLILVFFLAQEISLFSLGLKLSFINQNVEFQLFTSAEIDTASGFLTSNSFRQGVFSSSYSGIDPRSNAGKQIV